MPTVDIELGRLLGDELARHGVQVVNDVTVKAIHQATGGGLTVAGEPDFEPSWVSCRLHTGCGSGWSAA
jgi:hypothetical protein